MAPPACGGQAQVLTLERVIALVRQSNPHVAAARLRAEAASADIVSARVPFPSNPVLEMELGDRSSPGGDSTDRHFSLSQEFFTAPVRGRRVRAAEAAAEVARQLARNESRLAEAAAARLFFQAVAARERVVLLREVESVTQRLVEVSELRYEAGEDTALDLNTARIQRAHAARRRLAAERTHRQTLALLSAVLGLEPRDRFEVQGNLDPPASPPLEDLAEIVPHRPDVMATQERIRQMEETVSWRKAERWPELEAALFYEEEEDDIIRGGGLAISIPLVDRNKGRIARARAETLEAEARSRAITLEATAEIARARAALESAEEVLALYDDQFLAAARENVSLMELGLREGKVRLAEVLVLRHTLVEAREEHLEARLERVTSTVDLLTAAGLPLLEVNDVR
jgi:outer membrane protein TolC